MKSLFRRLIILLIIAAALYISNPDLKKHQDKIVEKFKQENPVTGALGAGELIKQVVAYDNYYICSLGKISVTNETVSFGIAGFVIVYSTLDLMKYKDKLPDFSK